jgi:hypothetical protein
MPLFLRFRPLKSSLPAVAARRPVFRRFANVRQKRSKFAKDWQNHSPRAENILPMFGKIGRNLPNIGKTA